MHMKMDELGAVFGRLCLYSRYLVGCGRVALDGKGGLCCLCQRRILCSYTEAEVIVCVFMV
jgi:hypothetical protein